MKYRLLENDELELFREEFIQFLVVNGIPAGDWEKLKKDNVEKAEEMIRIFSDFVFGTVLSRVKFLEIIESGNIKTFQCLEDRFVLVGFDSPGSVNSTNLETILSDGSVYFAEKKYTLGRNEEIFALITSGCSISDGQLFKQLSLLLG